MFQYLLSVVNLTPTKDVRLIPRGIEEWEVRRPTIEQAFDEKLSEKMAAAVLSAMLPQRFQDMIFASQGTTDISYQAVR